MVYTSSVRLYQILHVLISLVWFINGLYCKVLNFVPRHREIVARILGSGQAKELTIGIGLLEILLGIWILTGRKSVWCAWIQILLVATMNVMEFILVPDLLLFGKFNLLWATLFIIFVFIVEFVVGKKEVT